MSGCPANFGIEDKNQRIDRQQIPSIEEIARIMDNPNYSTEYLAYSVRDLVQNFNRLGSLSSFLYYLPCWIVRRLVTGMRYVGSAICTCKSYVRTFSVALCYSDKIIWEIGYRKVANQPYIPPPDRRLREGALTSERQIDFCRIMTREIVKNHTDPTVNLDALVDGPHNAIASQHDIGLFFDSVLFSLKPTMLTGTSSGFWTFLNFGTPCLKPSNQMSAVLLNSVCGIDTEGVRLLLSKQKRKTRQGSNLCDDKHEGKAARTLNINVHWRVPDGGQLPNDTS
ncbi:hypothetical protein F5146DRAFT_1005566 [Armillaria mellea]|nr:hypothetical protein F5146DRAFT_1005566 [Armillaria mellea]